MATRGRRAARPARASARSSALELSLYVGRRGRYRDFSRPNRPTIWWDVKILDARIHWGTVRVLVEPVSGEGCFWTDLRRITLRS